MAQLAWLLALLGSWQVAGTPALQEATVTVTGIVSVAATGGEPADKSDIAVWLKPVDGGTRDSRAGQPARPRFRIVQQNKRFVPRVLVVPTGSFVEFPNLDPFFHNVFSLFDGKRFDLGLYEAGTSRSVAFTNPGVCYVFCNIHPDMTAVVVVVDSPYYTVSNRAGEFTVTDVPPGRYLLSVWHERFKPESPTAYPREVTISPAAATVGAIRLVDSGHLLATHKNKYGHDYTPPTSSNPLYK